MTVILPPDFPDVHEITLQHLSQNGVLESGGAPKLLVVTGLTGAGKSTWGKAWAQERGDVLLDVDETVWRSFGAPKDEDEYNKQRKEVLPTAKAVLEELFAYQADVVWPAVGAKRHHLVDYANAKKAGYEIEIRHIAAPHDICDARAKNDNRFINVVSDDVLEGNRRWYAEGMMMQLKSANNFSCYWNPHELTEGQERTPILAWSVEHGEITVHDAAATHAYLTSHRDLLNNDNLGKLPPANEIPKDEERLSKLLGEQLVEPMLAATMPPAVDVLESYRQAPPIRPPQRDSGLMR